MTKMPEAMTRRTSYDLLSSPLTASKPFTDREISINSYCAGAVIRGSFSAFQPRWLRSLFQTTPTVVRASFRPTVAGLALRDTDDRYLEVKYFTSIMNDSPSPYKAATWQVELEVFNSIVHSSSSTLKARPSAQQLSTCRDGYVS